MTLAFRRWLSGSPRSSMIRRPRIGLHPLESREVPATFTVNTLADNNGSGTGTSGTLRYCIALANSTPGADSIDFSASGTPHTLQMMPTSTSCASGRITSS